MIKDLFQIYKIGKELGLNKKEIKFVFLFNDKKHSSLYTILLILFIIAFGALIIFLSLPVLKVSTNSYASGTYYSTVKEKDFKRRKRI